MPSAADAKGMGKVWEEGSETFINFSSWSMPIVNFVYFERHFDKFVFPAYTVCEYEFEYEYFNLEYEYEYEYILWMTNNIFKFQMQV